MARPSTALRASIDDLDALIEELGELRQHVRHADLLGNDEAALWDAEAGLRHLAERANRRAEALRRAIEVLSLERRTA